MATPTHEITHIQIGNETFEIVDAIARDSVALVYKWGRPSADARCPSSNSNNAGINFKNKHVAIAHILPNRNERTKYSSTEAGSEWESAWNYPTNDVYFNFNDSNNKTAFSDFSFAFGQLNIHTTHQNNTATSGDTNARTIKHFMFQSKKLNTDALKTAYPNGKPSNLSDSDWNAIIDSYTNFNFNSFHETAIDTEIQNNGMRGHNKWADTDPYSASMYNYYSSWAWSTHYIVGSGDLVTTNTYITTQPIDLKGVFGVTCDKRIVNVWGNATTVLFAHSYMPYLGTSEKLEDQGTSNESDN